MEERLWWMRSGVEREGWMKQSVRGKGDIKARRGHRVKMAVDGEGNRSH